MELISESECAFAKAVFDIRDHYAHHVGNMHLSVAEVAEKIRLKGNGKIFEQVTWAIGEQGNHYRQGDGAGQKVAAMIKLVWFLKRGTMVRHGG
jgi:hypothetical protein